MLNFEVLAFWIETTEVGTECHEKDKCYLQIKNLLPKISVDTGNSSLAGRILSASAIICFTYIVEQFEFQTIDCSKQIPDLFTAGYISKGTTEPLENHTFSVYSLGLGWI